MAGHACRGLSAGGGRQDPLRVVEWRSEDGRYRSWEAVEGVYTIDDAGDIAVRLSATSRRSENHNPAFRGSFDCDCRASRPAQPPSVAIEIEEHAPIFVVGSVQARAGMLSVRHDDNEGGERRGGFLRSRGDNIYLLRDQIQAAGAYRTAVAGQRELLLRRAG